MAGTLEQSAASNNSSNSDSAHHWKRCKHLSNGCIADNRNSYSQKPQPHNINYKNKLLESESVGASSSVTVTHVTLKMLLICALLFCLLHAPTNALARKPTSQELGDDEFNMDLRKRNTQAANSTEYVEQEKPTEYPPRFKNPKVLSNILVKPSGSFIQLNCAAVGVPEPNITWTRNKTISLRSFQGRIKRNKWSIIIEDLVPDDSAEYSCKVCNSLGCIEHITKLIINDRVNHKPIVLTAPANLTILLNGSGQMECNYLSDLHSKKAWTFTPCNSSAGCSVNRTFIKEDVDILEFKNVTMEDEGWYTCLGINSLGQTQSSAYLRVVNGSQLEPNVTMVSKILRGSAVWIIIGFTILLAALLAIFVFYVNRKSKHEKLLKQRIETVHQWTKKVIIYKPSSGDSSSSMDTMIMPVVKIEKQRTTVLQSSNAEPAPFNEYEFPLDSNWELPRSQLVLGDTLGEGAFGRVVMAEVNNSIVAVKMVKEGHTDDDIASLVREMEVMKIIGKHINIINLLGCCSQNGPLYVIVEFAPHGNLKDFLYKNRPASMKEFADQQNSPKHYLTEKHLISFAFQIARGMEYLASRRCIHRDLAARNVLVSDDYVMKIADFGLARDIQVTDYYRKNTNGRLPIKWMAPESLHDKFYDSQSDVWSYGILLWEIMTFGAQPYPTIMSAEEIYNYLMSGQRMEKPPKCSLNIYMLMRQCWHFDASARPTFSEIVENLDKLLLANEDYLDVAIANLETPPSSGDEGSDVESTRYHYK
ncbi:fibroblast growth factor receptor homolog 1-like [Teleopsis dalmanni]|uniref:fibroblast growth factor receptor homolog 1-like n=1 Tax=Teleopsis dalmanni TaxID=139649 RepID=UPI0018CF3977|nr:fibroblast growth factor receptor homolog 1-like [Teleopsis dalmanni]XP_037952598.1 fibroblast growth factor receptor homolog 1-like [Teleopsis dalmanni]